MLNQKSIDLIKSFEGCHLTCYHLGDGVCTIGYGHTRPLSQCGGAGTWSITQAQAEQFLQDDLRLYESAVRGYFTRPLNDNQVGALTSFCYNLGTSVFVKYQFDPNGSDSNITSQMMLFLNKGTQFEAGITRRRQAETALFLDGNSSNALKNGERMTFIINALVNGKATHVYVTDGITIRHIRTDRMVQALGKKWASLNLPQDTWYIEEIEKEFGKAIDRKTGEFK